MPRIPFIHARFVDESQNDIEERLQAILKSWRGRSLADGLGIEDGGGLSLDEFGEPTSRRFLVIQDCSRQSKELCRHPG